MNNSYVLVGSEALSEEFNDLAGVYSDYHKDVYGFRPRHMSLIASAYENEAELREALGRLNVLFDEVAAAAPAIFTQKEVEQKKAIDDFEAYVTNCIQVGAGTRANAIAWVCESYNVANTNGTYGWEHLEYQLGIPFGYIAKSLVTP